MANWYAVHHTLHTHTRWRLRTERTCTCRRAGSHAELIFARLSCHLAFGFIAAHKGGGDALLGRERHIKSQGNARKHTYTSCVTQVRLQILHRLLRKLLLTKALIKNVLKILIGSQLKRFAPPKGHHVHWVANLLGTMKSLVVVCVLLRQLL